MDLASLEAAAAAAAAGGGGRSKSATSSGSSTGRGGSKQRRRQKAKAEANRKMKVEVEAKEEAESIRIAEEEAQLKAEAETKMRAEVEAQVKVAQEKRWQKLMTEAEAKSKTESPPRVATTPPTSELPPAAAGTPAAVTSDSTPSAPAAANHMAWLQATDRVKGARRMAVTWTEGALKRARVDKVLVAAYAAWGVVLGHVATASQPVEECLKSVCVAAVSLRNAVKAKGVKKAALDISQEALQLAQHAGRCAQARVTDACALATGRAREARNVVVGALGQTVSRVVEKKDLAKDTASGALDQITERASKAASLTQAKATELTSNVKETMADKKFQATAAPAVGGAMVGGASGGAAGLATGAIIGTAVGVVPALVTFGLSIPIGTMLGAGTGFIVGTTVGAAAGAVGGGAAGRGVYSKRGDLRSGAGHARDYVKGGVEWAVTQASVAASSMKEKASVVGTVVNKRLVGEASIGGTENTSN